ncbi:variable lymphocyte receptor C [Apostichopus japonicus]|uniref:Variable lymphocyte receptor C n=1 Tax=Stichopus japonicus TaxID=307972 RepID=A0A2G8JCT4_STIJA|nr:variable lymphocyte receptor C [Apostichopus japonicus]
MKILQGHSYSVLFLMRMVIMVTGYDGNCVLKMNPHETFLDCSRKNIVDVPTDIPHSVTRLSFFAGELHRLSPSPFLKLTLLNSIDFRWNKISVVMPFTFNYLQELTLIDLSRNFISGIDKGVFFRLKSLKAVINDSQRNRRAKRRMLPSIA